LRLEYAAIAIVIIAAAAWLAYDNFMPREFTVSVKLADSQGLPINATVQLYADDRLAAEAQVNGEANVKISAKKGAALMARASADGFIPTRAGFSGAAVKITMQRETARTQKTDFVIATGYANLEKKYGAALANEIKTKILELASAAQQYDGLQTQAIFLDGNYSTVGEAVNALQPAYLLIVGGPAIVPFGEAETPLKGASGLGFVAMQDPTVPTDNDYGVFPAAEYDCNECYPDVAVGRLPDGNDTKSESRILVDLLNYAIAAHEQKPVLDSMASLVSKDSYGGHLHYSLYSQLGNRVVDAPPNYFRAMQASDGREAERLAIMLASLGPASALFLSVHGSSPPWPQVFSASDGSNEYFLMARGLPALESQNFSDKIILADACYGGNPYRNENESLSLMFLSKGAAAFVGSTTSALANRKVSSHEFQDERELLALGSSTAFHYAVLKGLANGERVGDAVKAARREMQFGVPADELTAIQYVLYGDPTLKTGA